MRSILVTLFLSFVSLPGLAGPGLADETRPASKHPGDKSRWERLNPQEKQRLRDLYDRLKRMDPQAKAKLFERLRSVPPDRRKEVLKKAKAELDRAPEDRALKRSGRRFVESELRKLSREDLEKYRKLSPQEKRDYLNGKLEQSRKRLIERLPPPVRERALRLPSREQARLLERYRVERLLHRTFKAPGEAERVRSRPRQELLEALRPSIRASEVGRPDWISPEAWSRWLKLKPFEKALLLKDLTRPPPEAKNKPPSGSPRP